MELLLPNYLNTTTQMSITSNTLGAKFLFNPNKRIQYVSDGFADDLTTSSIVITFDSTINISRIALLETNLKAFDIYYNGVTANTFALTSTGSTVASSFSNNSESALFMFANTTAVTSITIDMKSTQVANNEKAIGVLYLTDLVSDFDRIPSAKDYKPSLDTTAIKHRLSDGGTRIHYVEEKFDVNIKFKYISTSFRDELLTAYRRHDEMIFVAFPTMTSWDAVIFPCVWEGPFDFYRYSDDASNIGFSGSIRLSETPS